MSHLLDSVLDDRRRQDIAASEQHPHAAAAAHYAAQVAQLQAPVTAAKYDHLGRALAEITRLAAQVADLRGQLSAFSAPTPKHYGLRRVEIEIERIELVVDCEVEAADPECGLDASVSVFQVWHRGADVTLLLDARRDEIQERAEQALAAVDAEVERQMGEDLAMQRAGVL